VRRRDPERTDLVGVCDRLAAAAAALSPTFPEPAEVLRQAASRPGA
jgi:hypothetical protein